MTDLNPSMRPHSAEYFGEERDYYWNSDYLDLLAKRLDLASVTSAADIGCGVGHWSALLYPRFASNASIVGIDREQEHIDGFMQRMQGIVWNIAAASTVRADATCLPLPNDSFDLATCQTVLLHLQYPAAALTEMMRITRPGGLVLCAEPNNMIARMPFDSLMDIVPIEQLLRLSELVWRHSLGRARRGRGTEHIGEQLPGLFHELGFEHVQVWLSDKAMPMIPPYTSAAERAAVQAWDRWRIQGTGPFDKGEMRANVLAGGGSEEFFDAAWSDFLTHDREVAEARSSSRLSTAGGVLFYIVAGRVPEKPPIL
jgi:ubiquinone/menaquinone biosynthesis C-methylase UbiE